MAITLRMMAALGETPAERDASLDVLPVFPALESKVWEMYVDANPCMTTHLLKKISERALRDIWYDPDAFVYNRGFRPDMLTGKCRKCEHRLICAGGCRSFNFFTHGKLYESLRCVQR